MPVEFNQPAMLWALGGVGLLWLTQRQTLVQLSPARRLASFSLRIAGFVLLVLALSDPRWLHSRRETCAAWLIDHSRSVGDEATKAAQPFHDSVQKLGQMKSAIYVPFAGRSTTLPALKDDEKQNTKLLQDDATDIAGALDFALASMPAGYARTILLFSDGRETSGHVLDRIAQLKKDGVRVMTVSVKPADNPEVLVRSVNVPRRVREEQPFTVDVEIVSNRETSADVDIFRNGTRIATQNLALHPGVNRLQTTQTVKGEKIFQFTAAVRAKQDTIAGNNQADALIQAEGKSKVLLISDKPEQARYLAAALRQEGIILDVRPITGAPLEMSDLQNYDLLILDNVAATDLTPNQLALMASYVRDFGGGFLMLGGDKSFGLGGYYLTPVEEILPVRCDFEKQKEDPSLGLALVVDRSGSMSGEKMEMAKEAAKAAAELLSPKDYITVVAFDNDVYSIVDLQLAQDKGGILQQIGSIEAGGGTNIAPGLEMAYTRLSPSPAKIKHVILLTDGVSTPGPFRELINQMAQDRITVSTVGVGSDADQQLLQDMASWGGGRFYYTDNPQSVPQIFARETMSASKSSVQEVPFLARPGLPAPFLSGIDLNNSPFLLGFVLTKPKPTAELWLTTESGDPLFATWRYGLGQAGAFTSDARNRWAVEWLKWDGYGKFWAQVVRRLSRSASLARSQVTVLPEQGGERVIMDVLDEQGRYLPDTTGELLILSPSGKTSKAVLHPTAPGRLEGWWPTSEKGAYHLQATLQHGGEALETQYLSTATGYPDEFLLQPPDEGLLAKLATETGGIFNPTPAQLLEGDRRSAPWEIELWTWCATLALLCFLADVAVRRWPENLSSSARPISSSTQSTIPTP